MPSLVNVNEYQITLVDKKEFFNRAIPPEETSRRPINIRGGNRRINRELRAVINNTSLIFARMERDELGREPWLLMRKDFWMTNDINMET